MEITLQANINIERAKGSPERVRVDSYRTYVDALVDRLELDTTEEALDQRVVTTLAEWLPHVRMESGASPVDATVKIRRGYETVDLHSDSIIPAVLDEDTPVGHHLETFAIAEAKVRFLKEHFPDAEPLRGFDVPLLLYGLSQEVKFIRNKGYWSKGFDPERRKWLGVGAVAAAAIACGLPFGSESGDILPASPAAAATPALTDGPTPASTLVKKDTSVPPSVTRQPDVNETKTPPPESRKTPTIDERKLLLSNPDFFMKSLDSSGRRILKAQFDDKEWERIDDKTMSLRALKEGGCGISVIAAIDGAMGYLHTGKVPHKTNADTYNFLVGKDHDGYVMIPPKGSIWMYDIALTWALDLVGQNTGLFSTVDLTPNYGFGDSHLVPRSDWSMYFNRAKNEVLDNGGLVVARVLKYGKPRGTTGHFIIISSIKDNGELLIVDSVGPDEKGSAGWFFMENYTEPVAEYNAEGQRYVDAGKPSLLWMAGVVPTF